MDVSRFITKETYNDHLRLSKYLILIHKDALLTIYVKMIKVIKVKDFQGYLNKFDCKPFLILQCFVLKWFGKIKPCPILPS